MPKVKPVNREYWVFYLNRNDGDEDRTVWNDHPDIDYAIDQIREKFEQEYAVVTEIRVRENNSWSTVWKGKGID
jgi:hypothetical protein